MPNQRESDGFPRKVNFGYMVIPRSKCIASATKYLRPTRIRHPQHYLASSLPSLIHTASSLTSMRAQDLPSYNDIPKVPGMPHGCAWGLWDKNGEKDQLGSLNLLTAEVVQAAGKEIQTGDRCVLKYVSIQV